MKSVIKLARWFEWEFGTILIVAIGIIVTVKDLHGFGQWILIIGLILYFIASILRFVAERQKLNSV